MNKQVITFLTATLQGALPTKCTALNHAIRPAGCFLDATVSFAFQKKELNPGAPSYRQCVHVALGSFVER